MYKRFIFIILLLLSAIKVYSQTSSNEQDYNLFHSRGFMKFNRFLMVPTFSALREDKTSLMAIVRNSNVEFDDNPRTYLLSYSGKTRENIGAGIAVYQQEVGVFKDFGAIANYAQKLKLNDNFDLTFGFNFVYTRRSADIQRALTPNPDDPALINYQDRPVVLFQPAITLSFDKVDVGVFFENIADFNLKESKVVTSFGEKIFSAHARYTYDFTYASGLFKGADLRFLALVRKPGEDPINLAANAILNLPKVGWVRAGYDKEFGISAGLGVNISDQLAIGFSYEKSDFAATNEVGIIYNFGKKRYTRRPARKKGKVNVALPTRTQIPVKENDYKDEEHGDLSDEIQRAQDSIDSLHRKLDEALRLLKNQPPLPKNDTIRIETASKDTSLKRSNRREWSNPFITRGGGGGTMYYVVVDRFKSKENLDAGLERFKARKLDVKYVFDPVRKSYFVYLERFSKRDDADDRLEDFEKGPRLFENEGSDANKKTVEAYVVKISLEGEGSTFKEPKTQSPARVYPLKKLGDLEEGYYLRVSVNAQKAYADKFVDELRAYGIDADYYIYPETGHMHVYIAKTKDREEIIKLYNSNLNGKYYDKKSIIHIK